MVIEDISRKVSKELGIKYDIVERLHRIQYRFLFENLQSDDLNDVQLMYIGKFTKNKRGDKLKAIRRDMGGMEESSIHRPDNRTDSPT